MASSFYGRVSFLLSLFLLVSCSVVVAYDGKLLKRICSGNLYDFWSSYSTAVGDLLDDLTSHTSGSPELDYYSSLSRPTTTYALGVHVYGHAVCSTLISPGECTNCLNFARSEMFKECTHSIGAQIRLMDCRLRYEDYKFNNDD